MRGVSTVDLNPDDYNVAPSERVREYEHRERETAADPLAAIETVTDGISEVKETDLRHRHDVETANGTTAMHVLRDRRHVDGLVGTAGKRYLFVTPDGERVIRLDREGTTPNSPWLVRKSDTETVIATVNSTGRFLDHWRLADADGEHRATAKFRFAIRGFFSPIRVVEAPDGDEIAEFSAGRKGRLALGDVRMLASPAPLAVGPGFAHGVMHRHPRGETSTCA